MYYNGTSERYWWNQDSDAVNVYVPVPDGFELEKVEFVAKTRHISLKFDGEEVRTSVWYFSYYVYRKIPHPVREITPPPPRLPNNFTW